MRKRSSWRGGKRKVHKDICEERENNNLTGSTYKGLEGEVAAMHRIFSGGGVQEIKLRTLY